MLAVLISACLISDPDTCRDHRIPIMSPNVNQLRCTMHAPIYFGNWSADNPGWKIKSWRCVALQE